MNLATLVTNIANSIRRKTGKKALINPQNFPSEIDSMPTELAYEDIKDVMFMDYNGDVLYSYDKQDFIDNVTALPDGPTWHDGLTFQEWNWDLADIKDELQNGSGACCIGAHYTTTDGKTHFFIDLKQEDGYDTISLRVTRLGGTIVVEWGDGTSDSYTATQTVTHTYPDFGKYEMKIAGQFQFNSSAYFLRPYSTALNSSGMQNNFVYAIQVGVDSTLDATGADLFTSFVALETISLHKNYFGATAPTAFRASGMFTNCVRLRFFLYPKLLSNVSTTTSTSNPLNTAFSNTKKLVTISFPKRFYWFGQTVSYSGIQFLYFPYIPTLTIIGNVAVSANNSALKKVVMKFDSVVGTYANGPFYNAFGTNAALRSISVEQMANAAESRSFCEGGFSMQGEIVVPSTTTSFSFNTFQNCYGVKKYIILGDITSINQSAFYGCFACEEFDFTHCTTVPTLANANAFTGIALNCVIKVPAALETAWKTATNWSTYASRIVGV